MRALFLIVSLCAISALGSDVWIEITPNDDNGYTDGYMIYRRKESAGAGYTFNLDVGKETQVHILNLEPTETYLFAASSYTRDGREGVLSDEVKATPKATPTPTPTPLLPSAFRSCSARAKVAKSAPLFAGFVVDNRAGKVLVRAISTGLPGALADPIVQLRDPTGKLVAQNDDWKSPRANEVAVRATGFPLRSDRESALVVTLPPGSYVAVVYSKGAAEGAVLLQVSLIK